MEDILVVACFWLAVLSLWLGWKIVLLRRALRLMHDWQRLAMTALENVYGHPRPQEDDSILDSEVIQ